MVQTIKLFQSQRLTIDTFIVFLVPLYVTFIFYFKPFGNRRRQSVFFYFANRHGIEFIKELLFGFHDVPLLFRWFCFLALA